MGGKQCFRCGSPQHLADKCSHVESTCNYCGKPGHLAKACFKKKKEFGGNNTTHQVIAAPISDQEHAPRSSTRIPSLLVQFQIIFKGVFVFYTPWGSCRKRRPWSKFCTIENCQQPCCFLHSFSV